MPPLRTLLIATPSCDVYGSDLQMLETVRAMREAGWRVLVTAPSPGPLEPRLVELGAEFEQLPSPVLRRADATPIGVVKLGGRAAAALPGMVGLLREVRPDVVLVNTITLPLWPAAVRSVRRPRRPALVVHVHEAEDKDKRVVRRVLAGPLRLADTVMMNSTTTLESMCAVTPALRRRAVVVPNGVEPPPHQPQPAIPGATSRVTVVGRLSKRKAPEVAMAAVALLRAEGRDVELELVGSPAEGAEEFREELVRRAAEPDLAGAVHLTGYASPVWPALARADIVVAPSLGESFGNAVVEAQLALRPVVATGVQGHLETITDGETGLHVPPGDAPATAAAIAKLLDDAELATDLARRGREVALERFTAERYRAAVRELLEGLSERRGSSRR